jgi:hypothetical protein
LPSGLPFRGVPIGARLPAGRVWQPALSLASTPRGRCSFQHFSLASTPPGVVSGNHGWCQDQHLPGGARPPASSARLQPPGPRWQEPPARTHALPPLRRDATDQRLTHGDPLVAALGAGRELAPLPAAPLDRPLPLAHELAKHAAPRRDAGVQGRAGDGRAGGQTLGVGALRLPGRRRHSDRLHRTRQASSTAWMAAAWAERSPEMTKAPPLGERRWGLRAFPHYRQAGGMVLARGVRLENNVAPVGGSVSGKVTAPRAPPCPAHLAESHPGAEAGSLRPPTSATTHAPAHVTADLASRAPHP